MSTDTQRLIADAIEDAQDGQLDPERLHRMRQLLLTDPAARRYYLQLNELNHCLATQHFAPQTLKPAVGWWHNPFVPGLLVAAGLAVVLLVAISLVLMNRPPTGSQRHIALLEHAHGDVMVTGANAVTRPIQAGAEVYPGDVLRTQGSLGSATLAYSDGTRLSLVGSTSLTMSGSDQKRIVLHSGTLFAAVEPQQRPMLITTPQDEVQVVGTRFALDASTVETDLSVSEGRVRLTRLKDGQTVEVPAGQRVVSNAASELVVEAIPPTPDVWSESFEDGLPPNWELGTFVARDLPAGSQGAVRAVRDVATAEGTVAIATQSNWTRGLFAVHDDTHLHFTFKMRDPGWFNILLLTRSIDEDPPTFAGNHIFDRPLWDGEPDQWAVATLPLSAFRRLPTATDDFPDAIPFQLMFSSPDRDRGLTIDRIWVTRGGSGEVKATLLKESPEME